MPQLALCASNSDDPYTPEEYVNDLYRMVWEKTLKNTMLTDRDMNLQLLFLGKVMASSTVAAGSGILEPVRQQGFYLAEPGAERYSIYEIQKSSRSLSVYGMDRYRARIGTRIRLSTEYSCYDILDLTSLFTNVAGDRTVGEEQS